MLYIQLAQLARALLWLKLNIVSRVVEAPPFALSNQISAAPIQTLAANKIADEKHFGRVSGLYIKIACSTLC